MKLSLQTKDIYKYLYLTLSLIGVFWCISIFELLMSKSSGVVVANFSTALLFKMLNDFWCGLVLALLSFPIFFLVNWVKQKPAAFVIKVLFTLFVIIEFSLAKYSLTTLINLGSDILGYSFDDIFSTVSVSESISITYFIPFAIFPLLFFLLYVVFKKHLNTRAAIGIGVLSFLLFGSLKLILPESSEDFYQNKIAYLSNDIIKFQREKRKLNSYDFLDRNDYPLMKPFNDSKDVLSPFLETKEERPNIVFIVVEGLGSEFVNGDRYSGFTPFLDSIIPQSLYWENFVSTTGRSFGILPSLFGSLPYGEKGFLELSDIPSHLSLISVLKHNGYHTSYYSGGSSNFDRMINFLEYNGVDNLIDENTYGPEYIKTNSDDRGFSWGYPDGEIFRKTLSTMSDEKQPRLDIVMTLSSHEPFEFPRKEAYIARVDEILKSSQKSASLKDEISNYKDIFGCLLYTDNSIKDFIETYAQRPDFDNTIFIITGDHRLIPISQKDKLCRYHVPFLIYSPMLKNPETFKSVSSHWDVTPSLLNFLSHNYKFKPIDKTAWMGTGLDTVRQFRNIHKIPLMRYKGNINDMLYNDYLYSDGELFKINENFGTYKVTEVEIIKAIEDSLFEFKKLNAYVTKRNKIFPDSLNLYVTPKIKFSKDQLVTINKYIKEKTFDEVLLIARDLAFKKEYKTTRLLCDYILNEYPNYTDAIILKGRTLAWQKDYSESEKSLLNALNRSPFYDDGYLAILDLYWWSGQEEKSQVIYQRAIKNKVLNSEIGFKMAKALQRMGNIEYANNIIDSLIQFYPDKEEYMTFKTTLN